jgi:hypothetical protein
VRQSSALDDLFDSVTVIGADGLHCLDLGGRIEHTIPPPGARTGTCSFRRAFPQALITASTGSGLGGGSLLPSSASTTV